MHYQVLMYSRFVTINVEREFYRSEDIRRKVLNTNLQKKRWEYVEKNFSMISLKEKKKDENGFRGRHKGVVSIETSLIYIYLYIVRIRWIHR